MGIFYHFTHKTEPSDKISALYDFLQVILQNVRAITSPHARLESANFYNNKEKGHNF